VLALSKVDRTVTSVPATNSLGQVHQLDLTRRRLGRIGDIAFADAAADAAAPLKLVPTAAPAQAPMFPLGAQTRRVDAAGRLKPGLDAGNLTDLLGWAAGGLEVTVVEGWLLLHQNKASLMAPSRRCGQLASFSVTANGVERVALRPAHLQRISLPADRYLLLAPLPDVSALVAVNPAACLVAAPIHITAALRGSERNSDD
jgi:hypothetical protein